MRSKDKRRNGRSQGGKRRGNGDAMGGGRKVRKRGAKGTQWKARKRLLERKRKKR